MISFLTGNVFDKNSDSLTLLVGGVGYLVNVAKNVINSTGDNLELFIYTHMREDCLDLYGFKTKEELELFKLLLGVSGVGPKTALLVIDRGVEQVKQAIIKADEGFFTLVPRLGKKNAQKIIIELKSKLGGLIDLNLNGDNETSEALEALLTMGYTRQEAARALQNMPSGVTKIEEKIKWALKNL